LSSQRQKKSKNDLSKVTKPKVKVNGKDVKTDKVKIDSVVDHISKRSGYQFWCLLPDKEEAELLNFGQVKNFHLLEEYLQLKGLPSKPNSSKK